jgi:hypothetical protein
VCWRTCHAYQKYSRYNFSERIFMMFLYQEPWPEPPGMKNRRCPLLRYQFWSLQPSFSTKAKMGVEDMSLSGVSLVIDNSGKGYRKLDLL